MNYSPLLAGSNKYLLDKNYGGVLIIWDRLFGTFQEKLAEETIYGLVFPPNSFNPIKLQVSGQAHFTPFTSVIVSLQCVADLLLPGAVATFADFR